MKTLLKKKNHGPAVAMGELNRCSAQGFLFFFLIDPVWRSPPRWQLPRLPMNHWGNCVVRRPARHYHCFKWDVMEGVLVVRTALLFSFFIIFFLFSSNHYCNDEVE